MKSWAAFAIPAVLLTGCAVPPRLPDDARVNVQEIVDRVQCELYDAYVYYTQRHKRREEFVWLKDMAAAYSLQLSVDQVGGVSVSSDFIHLISAGTFTLGTGAGAKATTTRTAKLGFSLYLKDLRKPDSCPEPESSKGLYFSGGTGMREWLDRVLESFDKSDQLYKQRPNTLSHQLEFIVAVDGNVSPSWSLRHAKPKGALNGSIKDTHTLTIALAKAKVRDEEDDDEAKDGRAKYMKRRRSRDVDPNTQFQLNQELFNLEIQRSLRVQ